MTITHKFHSGNSCDIHVAEDIRTGLLNNRVQWECFPPSTEDLQEYHDEVVPGKLIPAMAEALQAAKGPGHFVEVMPGIWGWMEAGCRNRFV
jgi:hypothetical protein